MSSLTLKSLFKSSLTVASRSLTTTSHNNAWFFSKDKEKSSGHSTLLSKDQSVYEMVTDTVIPKEWDSYLQHKKKLVECASSNADIRGQLVGSWTIVTGDAAFKAFHLYKYEQGWTDIDTTRAAIKQDSDYQALHRAGLPDISEQFSELTKAFSFWPSPDQREGGNVYDIRTYSLKPGSMYDWSNYWARGIQYRSAVRPDVPYAGLFTQLGELHTIYHIWCYKSMADRKACREATWHYPEWNDVVANTVPLVKTMKTRILEPLDFSPTQ
eukprot:GFUD01039076.1.p1 GENE.GFUD01039076.1~~GFUD01039076.1.p1  ORF type:complete len:269 (+),score=83.47 GFUD01039076.1:43-849(+)